MRKLLIWLAAAAVVATVGYQVVSLREKLKSVQTSVEKRQRGLDDTK